MSSVERTTSWKYKFIYFLSVYNTYFLALSFRKLCSSSSFWLPISRRRVVNLLCHSLQWPRRANFNGELSSSTKSMFNTVSSFWKLLAISVYLENKRSNSVNHLLLHGRSRGCTPYLFLITCKHYSLNSIWEIWVIDLVWGQDCCILAKFYFVCSWTEMESRSTNTQELNEPNIHSTWLNKLGQ